MLGFPNALVQPNLRHRALQDHESPSASLPVVAAGPFVCSFFTSYRNHSQFVEILIFAVVFLPMPCASGTKRRRRIAARRRAMIAESMLDASPHSKAFGAKRLGVRRASAAFCGIAKCAGGAKRRCRIAGRRRAMIAGLSAMRHRTPRPSARSALECGARAPLFGASLNPCRLRLVASAGD
jgi:hypothetical protein